jgi:hypothetical protein
MSKKDENAFTPDEIQAIYAQAQKAAERRAAEEAEAKRKEQPFDAWPEGTFIGEIVDPAKETLGGFGKFRHVRYTLIMLGDKPDGSDLSCVIPRGNYDDFSKLAKGERFVGMYRGKKSRGTVTVHDLLITPLK